jgi:hypothetical protein
MRSKSKFLFEILAMNQEKVIFSLVRRLRVSIADMYIELEKRRLHNAAILTSWLGLETAPDANNAGQSIVSATKRDPKCRFMLVQLMFMGEKHASN